MTHTMWQLWCPIAGVPMDLLAEYPHVRALHTRIATLPTIQGMFSKAEGVYKAFQPQQ